jgi:hypothetical protein
MSDKGKSRMKSRRMAIGLAALLVGFGCAARWAPGSGSTPSVDLTGLWLVQDPGSGDFTNWANNVPKPQLKPEIIEQNKIAAARAQQTVFHNLNDHTNCAEGLDIVLMMESSPALNIAQSKDEVLMAAESGRARFIYTDGRPHHDIKRPYYEPTGYGDSIGHWESNALVVDTIGFPQRMCGGRTNYIVTPGGGRALPTTHLTERYQLTDDGKTLTITFTWEDPAVFLKPHTYSYHYKNLGPKWPLESEDSARDQAYQERLGTSTIPPPQK